jgi:RNA polymerase sigma-70 factor, ECF subfamily
MGGRPAFPSTDIVKRPAPNSHPLPAMARVARLDHSESSVNAADSGASRSPANRNAESAIDARDRGLLRAIRGGSAEALEELIGLYWAPLVRFAARQLEDMDVAEDVVQDTFVHLWQRRAEWLPSGSARAYLFRITRNLVIDESRRREVRKRWRILRRRVEPEPLTPEGVLEGSRLWAAYEEGIASLSPRRREAFLLVHVQGLSHAEAAEVMGVTPRTVSNQVVAALGELRDILRRTGGFSD